MSRKGQILVHVLITTVIVAVISAGLAQMLIQRYSANARVISGTAGRKQDEASFNRVLNTWNLQNRVCYNSVTGFSCAGAGCGTGAAAVNNASCNCTMTPSPACTCPPSGSNPSACPGKLTATWDTTVVPNACKIQVNSCP